MPESIKVLRGIGETRAKFFESRGINTIKDLFYFFPRTYEDRSVFIPINSLSDNISACICAKVFSAVKETRIKKNMTIYSIKVADESGIMSIIWYNNRFVKGQFKIGDDYIFYGKITKNHGMWEMTNPIYEHPGKNMYTGRIMPIYPIGADTTQKIVQSAANGAMDYLDCAKEYLPTDIRHKYNLSEIKFSIKNMHFPKSFEEQQIARRRFAFEELYLLQLALLYRRNNEEKIKKKPFENLSCLDAFINSMPFSLTSAQHKVINEILSDFSSGNLMTRLVQGDVGSGKTAVAAAAMYLAVKNGYQTVIMAPTEILAKQHFETFSEFFKNSGINIILLTGSTKRKKDVYKKISDGSADIIIGTHAVIQDGVNYKNLGLVVADEQHRFGVAQRAALANKGDNPHFLVMSATPIPRTLALILYGDLDISVLDELPPGRKPVETFAVNEKLRTRVNAFIEKNVKNGSQCYVVCPLIDETQNCDLENAENKAQKLKDIFPQFEVGIIHGRMKPKNKEEIMERFSDGKINILVSTTVIEVGVNVPNSNIMIIENAERFGLSQLHQLRGRVGRGADQAYCILFSSGGGEITKKRLDSLCKSNDGFYISEQDLKLRGPGDFFGTRQHGLPELKTANLFEDLDILKEAQKAATETVNGETHMTSDEEYKLKEKIKNLLTDDVIIN